MVVHVRVAPPALGKAAAVPDSAFDVMTKAFENAGRVGELEQHNVRLQAQIITLQKQLTARNGASTSTAPSNTRSTTALMEPPAANPGARVIGKNASDRTVLTSPSRNQTHNYTFADMKLHDLNKHPELNPAMIPYSTMARWATQDSRGVQRWLSRRDENYKNSLPQAGGVKGGGTVLGDPFHAQLLKGGDGVYLGQTATGWVDNPLVNNPLKLAFANLQIDKGIIGKRPIVIKVDGHDFNLNNDALHELMAANKVILLL
ncbi:hypothetical protein T492DRAFT_1021192 [Pavlovales sp. CCMP2436]|nr:hypothetical protein T492DRAFT_1021192 [Pavlovales sp. CCMP2436]